MLTKSQPLRNKHYKDITSMDRQSFKCEDLVITYADSLLIAGEFTEDVVSVGRANPDFREGCEFLRHLIQQSPHLQQSHHGLFSRFERDQGD